MYDISYYIKRNIGSNTIIVFSWEYHKKELSFGIEMYLIYAGIEIKN